MTLEEVGKVFGLSRERIRQIEKEALERLKAMKLRQKLISFENLIQESEMHMN
jgi:DNA-directed RNA polymerase sigma subunit (sigma70/sigma32)